MITINSLEEMQKYYDEQINTYVFDDNVEFNIDIEVESSIDAYNIEAKNIDAYNIEAKNIYARDINAWNIKAWNINAHNIKAWNIYYYACCIAYYIFKCKSVKSSRDNSVHKCLDGKIEYIK